MKKWKITGIIVAIAAVILTAVYLAGRYYFMNHFYPKTTVNGVEVGYKTKKDALSEVRDNLRKYVLNIKSSDKTMVISANNCGLEYTGADQIKKLLEDQQEEYWFRDVFSRHDHEAKGMKINEERLREAVNNLYCLNPDNPQPPVDAGIVLDEEKKEYVIIDEIIGNTVEPETFYAAVEKAVLSGDKTLDMTTNAYYVQPKYHAADEIVQNAKKTLDTYMATVINYEDSGCTYTLDKENICKFITLGDEFKISFDKEVMKQFISDTISPVFNTVGKSRTFDSPGRGRFSISGGTYGWQVGLLDERAAMIEDIKAGQTVTREPKYLQDAALKDRTYDVGNSYIDASISDQHLWVVEKGKVTMQSDFVSGDSSKGRDTDKGIYMIEKKQRNYAMRENPVTVSYWLPFNLDLGEGFHDATWRKSFGGRIYTYNGSHGCINLPPAFAKKLYEHIKVGFPVVIH